MKLTTIDFVDLYVGPDFCDITGLEDINKRTPVPILFQEDIEHFRLVCQKKFEALREEEFSLEIDQVTFRVTVYQDIAGKNIFTLRRSATTIRKLTDLGFSAPVLQLLLAKDLRGLILIAGEMASGKTSTASSLIAERLKQYGGIGMSIEDPPETALNGEHGQGRCIQLPVSRRRGGYREILTRAMRSGANMILVGEIRDDDTAIEALRASINGHLIISTIHAGSIVQAIERLQMFCLSKAPNTNSILSLGLSLVIWQNLEKIILPSAASNSVRTTSRLRSECLVISNQNGVKTKIKEGKIDTLHNDIKEQTTKLIWMLEKQA
jgi:twitching motility protein PilT